MGDFTTSFEVCEEMLEIYKYQIFPYVQKARILIEVEEIDDAMEILDFLEKEKVEFYLGKSIEEAIISVPAYFNDEQRKATKKAGELAGLKVERIISEPTAAAIAYGIDKRDDNTRFLVFDLGGGTFDISILEMYGSIMEVRAVAGDNFIGGEDFTDILYRMFLDQVKLKEEDLSKKSKSHIKKQCEKGKIELSSRKVVQIRCNVEGEIYETSINIDDYEKSCELILSKLKKTIEKSLKDAKIKLNQIDEIILTDVCPFSLGTEVVIDSTNNRYNETYFCPIINSALIEFGSILDKQDKIDIENAREKLNDILNDIEFEQLY